MGETATAALSDAISSGTDVFLDNTTKIISFIVDNPLLVLLLVGGTIVPLGLWIFKKVKKAAK